MLKLLKGLRLLFNSSLTENQICYSKNETFFFFFKRLIILVSHLKSGDTANLFSVFSEGDISFWKEKTKLFSFPLYVVMVDKPSQEKKNPVSHFFGSLFSNNTNAKIFLELIHNLISWCCIRGKCYLKKCFSYPFWGGRRNGKEIVIKRNCNQMRKNKTILSLLHFMISFAM